MAGALRCGAGGIAGLSDLLDEYGEAIEWDIANLWPGRSIFELYRGEMSWRELRVFLEHLPDDSATRRAMDKRSADEQVWTLDRHLAAMAVDAIREVAFATIVMNGDPQKVRSLDPPDPIPRPGVEPRLKIGGPIRFGGRHGSGAKQLAEVFGAPGA